MKKKTLKKGLFMDDPLKQKTDVLGERLAAHLLRRTTYLYDLSRIKQFAALTPDQALDLLLQDPPTPAVPEPIDVNGTGQPWINSGPEPESGGTQLSRYVRAWWLENARVDPTINHRMMFFLHTAFTAALQTGTPGAPRLFDHLELLRYCALGNFKDLAYKMTRDTQMLYYLDNRISRKFDEARGWAPNENYAREFLELFTIGKGPQLGPNDYTNYTESDIQQAALVFTGVRTGQRGVDIDPDTGLPRGDYQLNWHDFGDKQFSYAFGNKVIKGVQGSADQTEEEMDREILEFIDMVYDQIATARFLCRRLYRFFVDDEIDEHVEATVIVPLADYCHAQNYELKPVLRKLLTSHHFYGEDDMGGDTKETIGALVKSPLELVLQAMNGLELELADPVEDPFRVYHRIHAISLVRYMFESMNLPLFFPFTVAGYDAYFQEPSFSKAWFDTTAIIDRFYLPITLLENKLRLTGGGFGARVPIVRFVRRSGHFNDPSDATEVVDTFIKLLLPERPDDERYAYFTEIFLDGLSPINWRFEWQAYIDSGDDSDVEIPLTNLVKSLMYSQEYQLF